MRDYQRKKNAYYLPKYAYRQALIIARSYPEVMAVLQNGEKRERIVTMTLRHQAEAVEAALAEVPEGYRDGVLRNVLDCVPLEKLPNAGRNTWGRWRERFLHAVAVRMHLV